MPYISPESRRRLEQDHEPKTAGEMNYAITVALDRYIKVHGLSYDTLNTVVGILECAKLELYRRVCAKYENEKMTANGDVYTA